MAVPVSAATKKVQVAERVTHAAQGYNPTLVEETLSLAREQEEQTSGQDPRRGFVRAAG